jgi:hypoxanthine phosphoribosyltransferase
MMMQPCETPLISKARIAARIEALAADLSRDYADRNPVLLVVLKGAALFAADLMRRITISAEVEFIRVSSYRNTESTGAVHIRHPPGISLKDRPVIVVEDILDTGRTVDTLYRFLREEEVADIALCTLLDKPARRRIPFRADYTGFTIADHFVVGYGLDYNEAWRHLPAVHVLKEDGPSCRQSASARVSPSR